MKDETQAFHLLNMMRKHKLYPEYELTLSLVLVKKNSLKKLSKGDVVLLGLETLEMIFLKEGEICANVVMDESENSNKIKIVEVKKNILTQCKSKKYEAVKISFGMLQIKKLEAGEKIVVSSLSMEDITLVVKDKKIAKGSLVNVDDEVAVQIDEVMK